MSEVALYPESSILNHRTHTDKMYRIRIGVGILALRAPKSMLNEDKRLP